MDDVPDQAGPSVIADEASSGSKAGTAAIGLAGLRWTKAAAAHSRGALLKRYGPPAALTAGLCGLAAWMAGSTPAVTIAAQRASL